jgi:hypothetical protein
MPPCDSDLVSLRSSPSRKCVLLGIHPIRDFSRFNRIFPQLLGDATEQMSLSLGQTLAGLLNATFGNAVEIIVGLVALFKGEVRIVQTSVCTRMLLCVHMFTV